MVLSGRSVVRVQLVLLNLFKVENMKLSQYIAELQSFLKAHGDLNCFYAADDEGNSYQRVSYAGSLLYTNDPDGYNAEMYCEEDFKEMLEDGDELTPVCVVN